jgi:hypothetical protein
MVLMTGRARNNAKIIGRTNVCGGMKKAGMANISGFSRVLGLKHNLARVVKQQSKVCVISSVIQTQRTGYRATLG